MTRFLALALTTYDADGRPLPGADDQWINLDHLVHLEEHLGNNLVRRHRLGNNIPAEHYPCIHLTTVDGSRHLVSLGIYTDQLQALDALEAFMPLLVVGDATTNMELAVPSSWTA